MDWESHAPVHMGNSKRIANQIIECFKRGNKLLIFGNGGSASQANHFAAEFVCKYARDKKPLNAISLSANQSLLTAISNDYGFNQVFSRQVEAHGIVGDIAIGLSTSGNSENVNAALELAELIGLEVIDFPRKGKEVGKVQRYQLDLMHEVCRIVEDYFCDEVLS